MESRNGLNVFTWSSYSSMSTTTTRSFYILLCWNNYRLESPGRKIMPSCCPCRDKKFNQFYIGNESLISPCCGYLPPEPMVPHLKKLAFWKDWMTPFETQEELSKKPLTNALDATSRESTDCAFRCGFIINDNDCFTTFARGSLTAPLSSIPQTPHGADQP